MKILFILGNGFDLNLGMKTSYCDFYDYYQKASSQSENIKKLKQNIREDLKNWSDLELTLGKYTENITSEEEFEEVFEDIGDNLANYLQQEEDSFDFSIINQEVFFRNLIYPENSLLKADSDKVKSFRRMWMTKIMQWELNILTFNYTRIIEKIIGDKRENIGLGYYDNNPVLLKNIIHIHGYIDERMIMGVNDISQISNTSFHKNQNILDAFVKDNCNQASKYTIEVLCKQQILSANLICVFGSSIGDTDNLWWELIGERLKSDDCRLVIFDKCNEIPTRREYKKDGIGRKRKDYFLNKTILSDQERMEIFDKIFIGLNTDMFKLVNSVKD